MHRLEQVVDRHAAGRGVSIDLDRLEAAQAMEVGDGLADVAHRQRAADASLDQIDERRLGRCAFPRRRWSTSRIGLADVLGRRRLLRRARRPARAAVRSNAIVEPKRIRSCAEP